MVYLAPFPVGLAPQDSEGGSQMAKEQRIRDEKSSKQVQGRDNDRKSDKSGNVGDRDITHRDETEWKRGTGQLVRKR